MTVRVRVNVPLPPALVALKVMVETDTVVGIPDIHPVAVSIAKPAGRPVALKLAGLLVAVI